MSKVTTAIIAAVAAGVDETEKELFREDTEETLADAYFNLKELLKDKYSDDSELIEAIYALEDEDTLAHRRQVTQEVDIVEADEDPLLIDAANTFLHLVASLPDGQQLIRSIQEDLGA